VGRPCHQRGVRRRLAVADGWAPSLVATGLTGHSATKTNKKDDPISSIPAERGGNIEDPPKEDCVTRCVQRAFLLGDGKGDSKLWIENRLRELAEIFPGAPGLTAPWR
jgi:hypothetical protein